MVWLLLSSVGLGFLPLRGAVARAGEIAEPTRAVDGNGVGQAEGRAEALRLEVPRIVYRNAAWLAEAKNRLAQGDERLAPALEALVESARRALDTQPLMVTSKPVTPPSGDKRDYMSIGVYWWPDPDTPDGLPWIRRDGDLNPMTRGDDADSTKMSRMISAVDTLALAWYLSGEERFAQHAATLIETWFLDPETRMNPNMKYAQGVPGRSDGRPWGLIEGNRLPLVCDAVGLLAGSEAWDAEKQEGMEAWFGEFLEWMLTSESGIAESNAYNNHATWYDAQNAAYALFTGQEEIARQLVTRTRDERIPEHIEPDGRQPRELRRTRSFGYAVYNLRALFASARIGDQVGVDLWRWETEDGRGIQAALGYLIEQVLVKEEWPHEEIIGVRPDRLFPFLMQMAVALQEPEYKEWIAKLPAERIASDRWQLLCPPSLLGGE